MPNEKSTLLLDLNGASYWTCALLSDPNTAMTIAGASSLAVGVTCLVAGVLALLIYFHRRPRGVWRSEVQAMADRDQVAYALSRHGGIVALTPAQLQAPGTKIRGEVFYPRKRRVDEPQQVGDTGEVGDTGDTGDIGDAGGEDTGTTPEVRENNVPPSDEVPLRSARRKATMPGFLRRLTTLFRGPTNTHLPRVSVTDKGSPASRVGDKAQQQPQPVFLRDRLQSPRTDAQGEGDSQLHGHSKSVSDPALEHSSPEVVGDRGGEMNAYNGFLVGDTPRGVMPLTTSVFLAAEEAPVDAPASPPTDSAGGTAEGTAKGTAKGTVEGKNEILGSEPNTPDEEETQTKPEAQKGQQSSVPKKTARSPARKTRKGKPRGK